MNENKNIQSGAPQSVLNENFERMTPITRTYRNIDRHPGTTYRETVYYDPEKERLKRQYTELMQENNVLKSELEKLKEKPQLRGNEDYHFSYKNISFSFFELILIYFLFYLLKLLLLLFRLL